MFWLSKTFILISLTSLYSTYYDRPSAASSSSTNPTQRVDIDFALQAAGIGVWEYDPATGLISCDNRCRELYGLSKDSQVTYELAFQRIHPDDGGLVDEAVKKAMNPQLGGRYEATYRTQHGQDGQLRWVHGQGKVAFTDQGEPYRFSGIIQEVTQPVLDPHRQVTALHYAQRQLRIHEAITASTPDLMYVFDLNYRFTYANQALLTMWGRSWEKAIGKGLLDNGYEPGTPGCMNGKLTRWWPPDNPFGVRYFSARYAGQPNL